jgi:hypothetical protein
VYNDGGQYDEESGGGGDDAGDGGGGSSAMGDIGEDEDGAGFNVADAGIYGEEDEMEEEDDELVEEAQYSLAVGTYQCVDCLESTHTTAKAGKCVEVAPLPFVPRTFPHTYTDLSMPRTAAKLDKVDGSGHWNPPIHTDVTTPSIPPLMLQASLTTSTVVGIALHASATHRWKKQMMEMMQRTKPTWKQCEEAQPYLFSQRM